MKLLNFDLEAAFYCVHDGVINRVIGGCQYLQTPLPIVPSHNVRQVDRYTSSLSGQRYPCGVGRGAVVYIVPV
mgnify:CR=1 FL=1